MIFQYQGHNFITVTEFDEDGLPDGTFWFERERARHICQDGTCLQQCVVIPTEVGNPDAGIKEIILI